MNLYVDANALVRLCLQSPDCASILQEIGNEMVPVTELLRFEVTNAIERMVFESRAGSPWRVSPETAAVAQGEFSHQLSVGVFFRTVPLSLADIETEFDTLVRRYTATHGFLSFDAKANALAKLVGLKTL